MPSSASGTARRMERMSRRKRLALIAHDNCKSELLEWARFNQGTLVGHDLHATGTTGALLSAALGLPVTRFASGPLGGGRGDRRGPHRRRRLLLGSASAAATRRGRQGVAADRRRP